MILHGDAFELLKMVDTGSVDLVLTDPPYGYTANDWDKLPPLEELWVELHRIAKPTAAFVFTAGQPFTSLLIMSNLKEFRHEWIWKKSMGSNFLNTKREPMKEHESVIVFSAGQWTYNPQRQRRKLSGWIKTSCEKINSYSQDSENYRSGLTKRRKKPDDFRVPSSVQEFKNERGLHPTQKPETLMRYLVSTYSNVGDLIIDPFAGSGTVGAAALALQRRFIGIEKEEKYVQAAQERLNRLQLSIPLS